MQMWLGGPLINLLFVGSYLIEYAHNSMISDFIIFGFHNVIFLNYSFQILHSLRSYQVV